METQRYLHLKTEYEQAATEEEKIDILVEMTLEVRNDDAEKAMVMAEEIIERSETIDYHAGLGNGLNHKGACYWIMGEYEDGLDVLTEAFHISEEINDDNLKAKVLNNFGRIYRNLGDLSNALLNFEAALEINERLQNELNQTINLTNISNLYYDLGDYDTALEYALKCLPIFEGYNDVSRMVTIYNSMGDIYFKKEQYEKSLHYFQKNQELTEKDTLGRSFAESGLGKVYYRLNDFEKARQYLDSALLQAKELDNPEAEIIAEFYIGRLHVHQGKYSEALCYLERAYDLAKDSLRRHDLMSIHEFLSDLYDKMQDIPKAFYHLKAYEKLKEEIFQQATLNKLRNLQIKNQIEVAQKEKEVAERTARLKQQFMANMSHEIRTPMNAIVGITRLLLEKDPKPEQLKYLNAIQQSADNLLVIINDILDLSKIEAGKILMEHIDFSLRDMIHNMYEVMLIKAEQKALDFRLDIDAALPDRLVGDPTRLSQILINLIGNAIKFTDEGFIALSCMLRKREADQVVLDFHISDSGIGISREYVDKIFESFTQAGTDTARKFGGTGLGLTISKQLVDLMNGDISVESEPGVGTTFRVIVPLSVSRQQEALDKPEQITEDILSRLRHLTILLVEDNEFNRMVAEDTLRSVLPDIRIDIAEDGRQAVRKVETTDYDLILMDIQMPVMNGVEATQYIRTQLSTPGRDTRIIAMTANVLQEDVQRYLDAGMNAYISKPFRTDDLLLKMAWVMERKVTPAAGVPESTETDQVAPLPAVVTDMNFLNQFTGGNPEKRKKYIRMFMENGALLLNKIKTALAQKDYATIKVAAHSLKPQLGYMGIREEVSNIFLIEQAAGSAAHYDRLPRLINQLDRLCSQAFAELEAGIA